MKESARTGISYIRSISRELWSGRRLTLKSMISTSIFRKAQCRKTAPSAGITMATAILSAVTGRKVHADVAMTGEITLRGRVLPIGGAEGEASGS